MHTCSILDYKLGLCREYAVILLIGTLISCQIAHIPRRPPVVRELSPESYYPVALLPGQYSDYYRNYTPQELRRLPFNTAMELPKVTTTRFIHVTAIS